MVELSLKASHQYWMGFTGDPNVYQAIAALDSVEKWVFDNEPRVQELLKEFGDKLDTIDNKFDLKKKNLFLEVGCYLHTSTVLMAMQTMNLASPGSASNILSFAEKERLDGSNKVAELFIRRNVAFERLRIIAKVFSPERLKLITSALKDWDKE